jgi:hypothetical protein
VLALSSAGQRGRFSQIERAPHVKCRGALSPKNLVDLANENDPCTPRVDTDYKRIAVAAADIAVDASAAIARPDPMITGIPDDAPPAMTGDAAAIIVIEVVIVVTADIDFNIDVRKSGRKARAPDGLNRAI